MTQNGSKSLIEKPLLGAVLCCTSIAPEDRTLLAQYAEQMGAEHKLDLTSDVTHLLVGATDTPKYQYVAREREDVKVLRPEWVGAVRECWMEDRPVDMNALEAEYRVPTLAGLKICITGFDDLSFRAQLQKNVLSQGGEYTGDLTKDVTHLIAAKAEGKKYDYATLWQKKVVSLQWYKDTLERGMQLDESCYHPARPVDEQGVGAWNREAKRQSMPGKRARDEQTASEPTRKLRRTASTKLGNETENLWGDIVRPPLQPSMSSREGFNPITAAATVRQDKQPGAQRLEEVSAKSTNLSGEGFLAGSTFVVVNFENRKRTLISQTLQAASATIKTSVADRETFNEVKPNKVFTIVPHQTRHDQLPVYEELGVKPTIVTELWLERCILQKSLIPPLEYPLGGLITPIASPEVKLVTINATGFQSIETLHIAKTVVLAGAQYAEVFTPKASVLVCNSLNINKQKIFHANQWHVPTVTEEWLCQFLTSGAVPNVDDFLVEGSEYDRNDLETELKQKRITHQANQSRNVVEDARLSNTTSKQSMSVQHPSARTPTLSQTVTNERRSQGLTKTKEPANEDQPPSNRHATAEQDALREISPNSPMRRNRPASSAGQKSLFQKYNEIDTPAEIIPNDLSLQPSAEAPDRILDAASMNSAIDDFLTLKARAKANASATSEVGKSKKNRLLDRALSNLSNASHASRHSRASSIDSLNTDGVGSEIGPPSHPSHADGMAAVTEFKKTPVLQGRAQSKVTPVTSFNNTTNNGIAPLDPSDPTVVPDEFGDIGNKEQASPPLPLQMTQLGYEDSAEAIALREKLAEKRRARARLGQNSGDPEPQIDGKEREALKERQQREQQQRERQKEKEKEKRVIKDDDTFVATGWGGGRRTRAKNRSADMMVGDLDMF